ncbi:MAG: InlB B-repeat-containing protein [Firmicutes bacterium]|nr:InlB B-repeat-containing protein [Bacillota bacterium]
MRSKRSLSFLTASVLAVMMVCAGIGMAVVGMVSTPSQAVTNMPFEHGDGTQTNPFQISTPGHLQYLAYVVNNAVDDARYNNSNVHYVLTADIDMDGERIVIGNSEFDFNALRGTFFRANFNGAMFEISNFMHGFMMEDAPSGLFGVVENAVIENLMLGNILRNFVPGWYNQDALFIGTAKSSMINNVHVRNTRMRAGQHQDTAIGFINELESSWILNSSMCVNLEGFYDLTGLTNRVTGDSVILNSRVNFNAEPGAHVHGSALFSHIHGTLSAGSLIQNVVTDNTGSHNFAIDDFATVGWSVQGNASNVHLSNIYMWDFTASSSVMDRMSNSAPHWNRRLGDPVQVGSQTFGEFDSPYMDIVLNAWVDIQPSGQWARWNRDMQHVHPMSFNDNGIVTNGVTDGEFRIVKPHEPTAPNGMYFRHWSTSSNGPEFDFTTRIMPNTTLYAVYGNIGSVEFRSNVWDGSVNMSSMPADLTGLVSGGVWPERVPTIPVRPGHEFLGWFNSSFAAMGEGTNGQVFDAQGYRVSNPAAIVIHTPNGSMGLYARWRIHQYFIHFIYNDEIGAIAVYAHNFGQTVNLPQSPLRDGHTFLYWADHDGEEFARPGVARTMPALTTQGEVLRVYAQFELQSFDARFYISVGNLYDSVSVSFGASVNASLFTPSAPNPITHSFRGWTDDRGNHYDALTSTWTDSSGNVVSSVTMPDRILLLFADFDANDFDLVVTLYDGDVRRFPFAFGATIINPFEATPTRVGYTFSHWETANGEGFVFGHFMGEGDVRIYAVWNEINVRVEFDAAGGLLTGTPYQNIQHTLGRVVRPSNPTKQGYTFLHWTSVASDVEFDFARALITEEITLRAVWTRTVITVTLYNFGGDSSTVTVYYGDLLEFMYNPGERPGFDFVGWSLYNDSYVDRELFDFETEITQGMILFAVWERNDEYNPQEEGNGNSGISPLVIAGAGLAAFGLATGALLFVIFNRKKRSGTKA